MKKSNRNIVLISMGILNILVVLFLMIAIVLTQLRAVSTQNAREMLTALKVLPTSPVRRVISVLGSCGVMYFCISVKQKGLSLASRAIAYLNAIEVIAAVLLMFSLDMNYNGVIFLVVAEMLVYVREGRTRILFLILALLAYALCNYNLITVFVPMNSFSDWMSYYPEVSTGYFMAFKTICEILNMVLLVFYIVFLILEESEENQRIKDLNDRLHQANEQLHAYAQEKELMGETRERNRLAREIHDTLGHILTGISVGVEAAQVLMDTSPEAAKEQLQVIGSMAGRGLNDVRRSVRKLKPDVLEDQALDVAIHQMIEETARGTHTRIYFVCYDKNLHFDADEEEAIYRMVQEGTTNAIRHGKATEIWIRLTRKENTLTLILSDNGTGCSHITEGFGLKHIRERVELLNGEVQFESLGGFNIIAKIPIRQKEEEKDD